MEAENTEGAINFIPLILDLRIAAYSLPQSGDILDVKIWLKVQISLLFLLSFWVFSDSFATPWTVAPVHDSSVHGIFQARILEWVGATFWKTPISRSALDKNPMLGHLLEGSLEYEGTTRRGTNTPVHHPEKWAGYTHSSASGLSPREQLETSLPPFPPSFLLFLLPSFLPLSFPPCLLSSLPSKIAACSFFIISGFTDLMSYLAQDKNVCYLPVSY